jgi:hypothetical protein
MERFGEVLAAFLRSQLRTDDWVSYAVFVLASGVVGLSLVLLDACSVALGRDSYLELTHGLRATPKAALVWVIGSMLGSGLGMLAQVFQPTPWAAILASLTWRTLLVQLQRLSSHQIQQKPGGE